MRQWENELRIVRTIVTAIYASVIIYAVMIYYRVPFIPYREDQTTDILFYALLALVPIIFLLTSFIAKLMISREKLADRFHAYEDQQSGLKAMVDLVRTAGIIMAAMGESCAVYGIVLYLISGNTVRPYIFLAITVAHYPLTMSRLRKAREDIAQISRSEG